MNVKVPDIFDETKRKNLKGLLFDTEYNNIKAEKATKIWCISCIDLNTGERKRFTPEDEGEDQYHTQFGEDFVKYAEQFDYFVGQNFWGAEAVVCRNLLGLTFKEDQVLDTLVLSRTQRPSSPFLELHSMLKTQGLDTRAGGHSLEAWGNRLGCAKTDFDEFDRFTFKMADYCDQDCEVNLKQFNKLIDERAIMDFPVVPLFIESLCHKYLVEQGIDGFKLNNHKAKEMLKETDELIQFYRSELHKVFPPKEKLLRIVEPRYVEKKVRDSEGKLVKDSEGNNIVEKVMHGTDRKTLLNNMHREIFNEKGESTGQFELLTMVEFNPNSSKQIGERLMDLGWNPKKYTATGQPSTSKDVLGDAIDLLAQNVPEVEVLRKYSIITHRNTLVREWIELAKEDGRVHGSMAHIRPWTHRSAHFKPNMGNVPKVSLDNEGKPKKGLEGNFGWDARDCLHVPEGKVLVGADASGIQLRALAHYMGDPTYIKEVCEGDIHTTNQHAAGITKGYLGMSPRDVSKRFIYAWLLGAGDEKVGQIVGCEENEHAELFAIARQEPRWNRWRHERGDRRRTKYDNLLFWCADKLRDDQRNADPQTVATILKGYYTKKRFLDNLPALKNLKENVIPQAARQGYMIGLDGRIIWVPSAHLAMGAYLQGFEAVIMKWAMVIYQKKLRSMGVPFKQVGYVHDEFQIETEPEYAETVGKAVVWAIKKAGEMLNCLCPLDGEYQIGTSWAETH